MDTSLTSTGRTEAVALSTQGVEPVLSMPGGLPVESSKSYLVRQDGHVFAGTHILADLWHGVGLDNAEFVESALREAADYADATVLHVYVHRFGEGDGISGVAVLAESHISIHTWPEIGLATIDVFMCGACRPERAVEQLEHLFQPAHVDRQLYRRGMVE